MYIHPYWPLQLVTELTGHVIFHTDIIKVISIICFSHCILFTPFPSNSSDNRVIKLRQTERFSLSSHSSKLFYSKIHRFWDQKQQLWLSSLESCTAQIAEFHPAVTQQPQMSCWTFRNVSSLMQTNKHLHGIGFSCCQGEGKIRIPYFECFALSWTFSGLAFGATYCVVIMCFSFWGAYKLSGF